MQRPKCWLNLPPSIIEEIALRAELDYDHWEESREDVIARVMRMDESDEFDYNYRIMQECYDQMSDSALAQLVQAKIEFREREINKLKEFLK